MDLNEILIFVKVVQSGSFSQAARALSIPKSTVSAKVAALEKRLGVSLLQRTTRQLHPTEPGQELFAISAKAIAEIEAGQALATRAQGTPSGQLRVTAPVDIATSVFPDFLCGYSSRYPKVQVDMVLTGRNVDLVSEGLDIAIRAGRLKDSSLKGRKLGISRFAVFASPIFLKGNRIDSPKDLEDVTCIKFSPYCKGTWELETGKKSLSVRVGGTVSLDDLSTVKELTLAGYGVSLLPIYLARTDVKAGRLVQLLPSWHSITDDVFILYPAQRFVQPKVKAFVTEAYEAFKEVFTDRC